MIVVVAPIVHVRGTELTTGSILCGCLHLVDLAGSERVDKSEATGERLREAQHMNRSLSALGDVIAALAQKSQHIPYRNSKLMQLLQESLGGQAKALMFVHISPELEAYGETLSTLKFAERVASVELGTARSNKESGEVRELKEQINTLKVALARKEGESEQLPSMKTSKVITERPTRGVSPMRSQKQSKDLQVTPNGRQTTQEARSISTGRHIKPTLARDIVVDDDTFSNSPRLLRRPSPDKRSASIERKTVPTERRSVSVDRRNQTRSRIKADMLEATEVRKFQDKIAVNRSIAIQNAVSRDEASVRPLVASDLAKHDSITDMFYQRRNNNAMKVYREREDKQFLGDTIERNGVLRCKPEQIERLDSMVKGTTEGSSTTTDDSSEVDLFRTSDVSDSELLHYKELNFVEAAPAPNIPRQKKLQYPSSRTSQQPDRRSPMKARSPASANRMITSMQSKPMAVRQSSATLQPSRTEMRRPSPGPKGQARFL